MWPLEELHPLRFSALQVADCFSKRRLCITDKHSRKSGEISFTAFAYCILNLRFEPFLPFPAVHVISNS